MESDPLAVKTSEATPPPPGLHLANIQGKRPKVPRPRFLVRLGLVGPPRSPGTTRAARPRSSRTSRSAAGSQPKYCLPPRVTVRRGRSLRPGQRGLRLQGTGGGHTPTGRVNRFGRCAEWSGIHGRAVAAATLDPRRCVRRLLHESSHLTSPGSRGV